MKGWYNRTMYNVIVKSKNGLVRANKSAMDYDTAKQVYHFYRTFNIPVILSTKEKDVIVRKEKR